MEWIRKLGKLWNPWKLNGEGTIVEGVVTAT